MPTKKTLKNKKPSAIYNKKQNFYGSFLFYIKAACFALPSVVLLGGCTPNIDSRGYSMEDMDFTKITIGKDNIPSIRKAFGSPSSMSGGKKGQRASWYYAYKKTETESFLRPKTVEQKLVKIDFDEKGIVTSVSEVGRNIKVKAVEKQSKTDEPSLMSDLQKLRPSVIPNSMNGEGGGVRNTQTSRATPPGGI